MSAVSLPGISALARGTLPSPGAAAPRAAGPAPGARGRRPSGRRRLLRLGRPPTADTAEPPCAAAAGEGAGRGAKAPPPRPRPRARPPAAPGVTPLLPP